MGYKSMEDWYKITLEDIIKKGGKRLLFYFGSSPSKMLIDVYPEHQWHMWRFNPLPRNYWKVQSRHREYFDWSGSKLQFTNMEDWYKVRRADIANNGGSYLLFQYFSNSPP